MFNTVAESWNCGEWPHDAYVCFLVAVKRFTGVLLKRNCNVHTLLSSQPCHKFEYKQYMSLLLDWLIIFQFVCETCTVAKCHCFRHYLLCKSEVACLMFQHVTQIREMGTRRMFYCHFIRNVLYLDSMLFKMYIVLGLKHAGF